MMGPNRRRRSDNHRMIAIGVGAGVAFVASFLIAVYVQIRPTAVQESANCHEAIAFWLAEATRWHDYAALHHRIISQNHIPLAAQLVVLDQGFEAADLVHASKIACSN